MAHLLQKKLRYFLDKKRLSVAEAERQAGLKTSAIRNILNGQSKNPSAQTLQKLSCALGCSIYDLLDNLENEAVVESFQPHNAVIKNLDIFSESVNVVLKKLGESNRSISTEDFFHLTDQIYQYAINNNLQSADKNFSEWVINEKLSDK